MPPRGKKTGASARGKAWVKQPAVPQPGSKEWAARATQRNQTPVPNPYNMGGANTYVAQQQKLMQGLQAGGGRQYSPMYQKDWYRQHYLNQWAQQPGSELETQAWNEQKSSAQKWAKLQTPEQFKTTGLQPTSTVMPDTFAAQQGRAATTVKPPWWSDMLTPQRQLQRQVYRDRGPIPRPVRVSPYGGYTEPVGAGGAGTDFGAGWNDWGGGGGYSYPDYSYGGGSGAYASPQGRGYNPTLNQTPRWWHNRLSWRF